MMPLNQTENSLSRQLSKTISRRNSIQISAASSLANSLQMSQQLRSSKTQLFDKELLFENSFSSNGTSIDLEEIMKQEKEFIENKKSRTMLRNLDSCEKLQKVERRKTVIVIKPPVEVDLSQVVYTQKQKEASLFIQRKYRIWRQLNFIMQRKNEILKQIKEQKVQFDITFEKKQAALTIQRYYFAWVERQYKIRKKEIQVQKQRGDKYLLKPIKKRKRRQIFSFKDIIASSNKRKDDIIINALMQKRPISLDNVQYKSILKILLAKNSSYRKHKELLFIQKFFSQYKIFQDLERKLTDQLIISLYRELEFFEKKNEEVLFYQGDIGQYYYIIIDGKIEILSDSRPDCNLGREYKAYKNKIRNKKDKEKQDEEKFDIFATSSLIVTLGGGASFGEIALRNSVPRTASVRCIQNTQFATLSMDSYNKIMKAFDDYKYNKQVRALRNFACFTDCPQYVLELVYMNMELLQMTYDNYIYKEGDIPEFLYFIKEGIVELRKKQKLLKVVKGSIEQYSKYNYVKKFTKNDHLLKEFHKTKKYELRMSQLGRNQVFGDQEHKFELDKRFQSAIVTSKDSQILRIDYQVIFIHFLAYFNKRFLQVYKDKKKVTQYKNNIVVKQKFEYGIIKNAIRVKARNFIKLKDRKLEYMGLSKRQLESSYQHMPQLRSKKTKMQYFKHQSLTSFMNKLTYQEQIKKKLRNEEDNRSKREISYRNTQKDFYSQANLEETQLDGWISPNENFWKARRIKDPFLKTQKARSNAKEKLLKTYNERNAIQYSKKLDLEWAQRENRTSETYFFKALHLDKMYQTETNKVMLNTSVSEMQERASSNRMPSRNFQFNQQSNRPETQQTAKFQSTQQNNQPLMNKTLSNRQWNRRTSLPFMFQRQSKDERKRQESKLNRRLKKVNKFKPNSKYMPASYLYPFGKRRQLKFEKEKKRKKSKL